MRPPILLLVLALPGAGCGEAGAPSSDDDARPARVLATIHPVGAIVREIAGPAADVTVLLPPGAHADTYEPTPRMAGAVAGADLVVRVGAGFDDWVGTGGGGAPVVGIAEGLRPGDGGSGAVSNPHVWLDPVLVRDRVLPRLAEALAAAAPGEGPAIRARAAAFGDSLSALHAEISTLLAGLPTRRFIAAHPAWTHFAARYDLEEVGVLHPSPGEEIGTRELARLVREARDRGVRAVIAEPQLGRAGVGALADELDVAIEIADPIGGPEAEGRDRYLDLMRWNARAFARALGAGS